MFSFTINFYNLFFYIYILPYFFYFSFLYKYICNYYSSFIYYRYIFKKIFLHILKLNKQPMQIMKCFIRLAAFLCPAFAFAQSTYIPLGSKAYDFIDRMEIKLQENKNLNFSTVKPYNRKAIVKEVEYLDSTRMTPTDSARGFNKYGDRSDLILTPVDEYNLRSLLMNSLGVNVRGLLAKRIGYYSLITDNQERGPKFFQDRVNQFRAVPGNGFYKPFRNHAYDYFDARGYLTFNAAKYIDFQFGYDKNFIGNGYRSLFLSDYGNSYLFFKINTRIWKFNSVSYTHLTLP